MKWLKIAWQIVSYKPDLSFLLLVVCASFVAAVVCSRLGM